MATDEISTQPLHIGWATTSITPDEPVHLAGQHYARISEGVQDPVTATALALISGDDMANAVILISCDLVTISDSLLDAVRKQVVANVPELQPQSIILNATHTHSAPLARQESDELKRIGLSMTCGEVELPAMDPVDYIRWASKQIAEAAVSAWQQRAPGSIGYGLGQAVVGRNRRLAYLNGSSQMYGNSAQDDFSHVEGYEDHSVNLLGTWDAQGTLTGLVINVACPSQVNEHIFKISADYWHDVRELLREKHGKGLFVLPQCSAAGDQSPRALWDKAAEERMMQRAGHDLCRELGSRIVAAVETVLPLMQHERDSAPVLMHKACVLDLPRRGLTQADVDEAMEEATEHKNKLDEQQRELEAHPEIRDKEHWYIPMTYSYRRWRWCYGVKLRFESQQEQPTLPFEAHLIRLGNVAIATNPFEYYLDFGIRIKARSPAIQTFLVQLTGGGTYVPTERAVAGKSYGAVPASTPIGPEGGHLVAEETLAGLHELWSDNKG